MSQKELFLKRFEKLNTAQREAVEHLSGPVMVIAGPGTGKTEILAARIANILQSKGTGADPHNILCLTYTDAGTIAMRKRLLEFIGPEAYKVGIYTFHAFCNEVIQQNLDYFGKRDLQPISDLEKLTFLEKIVDSFDSSHPLFQKSGYFEVGRLKTLFDTMKAENWSAQDISNSIDEYLADLPNREEFVYKRKTGEAQKGDLNQKKVAIETERMEKLRAAANEYTVYQKFLEDHQRYDYQDMILWVVKAFQENENILSRYQEQFQYILVDEYQDTNGAQNKILKLLTSFWEEPNIFVVGDDDQSIYRFQGANLKNILDFYNSYPSTKPVVLTENYRSSQHILDTAHFLISNNTERLTRVLPFLQKQLKAQNPIFAESQIKPDITEFYNIAHEEAGTVEAIESLQKQGVDLSEIAVIYSRHSQAKNIIKLLEQKKIPLSVKEATDIFLLPFTQKIIQILSYIANEFEEPHSAEYLLFPLMHCDFIKIDSRDAARFSNRMHWLIKNERLKIKNLDRHPESAVADEGSPEANNKNTLSESHSPRFFTNAQNDVFVSWRESLSSPELLESFNIQNPEAFLKLSDNIETLISELNNHPLPEFFEIFLTHFGILQFILNSEEKVWLMRVLTSFFNFLKSEAERNPQITLQEFLKIIDQMQSHKISLPINKITFAKKGINFVTAHSSKGLEFKYVFLIGCNKNIWDSKGRNFGYTYPDTLTLSNAGDEAEEARRLFFVALTRAKEHLHISYSARDMNDKELEASRFIAEIKEDSQLPIIQKSLGDESILEYHALLLQQNNSSETKFIEKEFIDDLLKNYRMNPTHLNKYLSCPLSFYYENILKVPAPKNEYMSFGTAVHYALEKFFRDMLENTQNKKIVILNEAKRNEESRITSNSNKISKSQKLEQSAELQYRDPSQAQDDDLIPPTIPRNDNQVFPPKNSLLAYFEISMKREQSSFTQEQFKRRLEYGKEVLSGLYNYYIQEWNTNVQAEYGIYNASFDEIPISGKLDKIEFLENGTVNVVDYKTGKYRNAYSKLQGPNEKNEKLGGDYWRQIIFYKILLDADTRQKWTVSSGEMDFIEPEKEEYKKVKILITPEDEKIVKKQIKEVYQKIQNHEFTGCDKEDCFWCNFK